MLSKVLYALLFWQVLGQTIVAQDSLTTNHWKLSGTDRIVLDLSQEKNVPYGDNIEMSGRKVSAILYYEIDSLRNLSISRDVIFPQLRTYNKTNEPDWKKYRAYFRKTIGHDISTSIAVGNKIIVPSKIDSVAIDGMLTFFCTPVDGLQVTKRFYPSMQERYLVEEWKVTNVSSKPKKISFKFI